MALAKAQMDDYLKCLTEPQRHAVTRPSDESLQILAGPGSGKTRVLTSRAAWMVKEGHVQPDRLVLVNFTDKAANEMVERLKVILGPASTSQLIIGEHSLSLRDARAGLISLLPLHQAPFTPSAVATFDDTGRRSGCLTASP